MFEEGTNLIKFLNVKLRKEGKNYKHTTIIQNTSEKYSVLNSLEDNGYEIILYKEEVI